MPKRLAERSHRPKTRAEQTNKCRCRRLGSVPLLPPRFDAVEVTVRVRKQRCDVDVTAPCPCALSLERLPHPMAPIRNLVGPSPSTRKMARRKVEGTFHATLSSTHVDEYSMQLKAMVRRRQDGRTGVRGNDR